MKPRIRIKFIDGWKGWRLESDYFFKLLSEDYDVEFSDSPDFVFSAGVSYADTDLAYPDAVKIVFCTENLTPDFNRFDYAIGFDHLDFGDRYLRMPLFATYPEYQALIAGTQDQMSDSELLNRKFCSFVVSNGWGDPLRLRFFEKLSKYKRVDSGGRVNNNIGVRVSDKGCFCRGYKFNIAFENGRHPGYTTEKVVQALAAASVPIYYGDPDIACDIDPLCMVVVSGESDVDRAIDEIVALDRDDAAYLAKCHARKLTFDRDLYRERARAFLQNVFSKGIVRSRRTARYGAQQSYRKKLAALYGQTSGAKTTIRRSSELGSLPAMADAVARYYDAHAAEEDSRLKHCREEYEITLAALSGFVRPGMRVLDLGGGTGPYAVALAQMGCDVLLADISESCVRLAEKNAASAQTAMRVMVADASDREAVLGCDYDLVLCLGPLYHCADELQADDVILNVMGRLRPGGMAVFSLLSCYSKLNDRIPFLSEATDADVDCLCDTLESRSLAVGDWRFERRGDLPVSFVVPERAERIFRRLGLIPEAVFSADAFCCDRLEGKRSMQLLRLARDSARMPCLLRGNHILAQVRKAMQNAI